VAQIINGGFEEAAFGDGSVRQILPGEKALPGWIVSDGSITWYKNGDNLNGNALSAHTGDLAINLLRWQCQDLRWQREGREHESDDLNSALSGIPG
jgi:hypothetical protein